MQFNIASWLRRGAVITDGAMGTMLQSRGLGPGEGTETWNLTHPEEVFRLHMKYLQAGTMWIGANTFGANRIKYPAGVEFELRELIFAGVRLAKQAAAHADKAEGVPVMLSVGPTGRLLEPFGDLAFEDAVLIFKEAITWGAQAGADAILVETMSDTQEARAAVIAAKETASQLPVLCTLTFEENERLLSGGTAEATVAILEGLGVAAIGINCGAGPERAMRILPKMTAKAHVPIIANPNAGLPRVVDGCAVFDMQPDEFAAQAEQLLQMGAAILGGCCGTTPAHIAATAALLKGKKIPPAQTSTQEVIAGAREVLPVVQCGIDELEEYDPEEPSFEPMKITCDDPVRLEQLLRSYNGRALVVAPEWAEPLVKKYGAVRINP